MYYYDTHASGSTLAAYNEPIINGNTATVTVNLGGGARNSTFTSYWIIVY